MLQRIGRASVKFTRMAEWIVHSQIVNKPMVEVLHNDSTNSIDDKSLVLCIHGPAYIEPEWGYIIHEDGFLLEESMLPNFPFGQRPFRIAVPSLNRFLQTKRQQRHIIEVPVAISLRHFWEWNYYHFYMDVLGKLELIDGAGLDRSFPLVLAKYAHELSFVPPLIRRAQLGKRQWIIPTREYVKAQKVIFCQTRRTYKNRISYIRNALGASTLIQSNERRIFLNRSSNRQLTNWHEVRNVLDKYSFEVIDTAAMSIEEQISIFANARYVVAIHGAGTTNVLFRGEAHLSLLELHHEQLLSFDHKRICDEMGYYWSHLEGKMEQGNPSHANFYISPHQLDEQITNLLNS